MSNRWTKIIPKRDVVGRILAFPFITLYKLIKLIAKGLYLLIRVLVRILIFPFKRIFYFISTIAHNLRVFFTKMDDDPRFALPSVSANTFLMREVGALRGHLIRCALAFIACCILSSFFVGKIVIFLEKPLKPFITAPLSVSNPLDTVNVTLDIVFITGLILSMPYIMFELFRFVAPGLYPRERMILFTFLPISLMFVIYGLSFGYFVFLPALLKYIDLISGLYGKFSWNLSTYMSLVTSTLFFNTLFFFMPIVAYFMAFLKIKPPRLSARILFLMAFVLATELTPGTMVIGDIILTIILLLVYYLFIGLMVLGSRGRKIANA